MAVPTLPRADLADLARMVPFPDLPFMQANETLPPTRGATKAEHTKHGGAL